MTIIDNDLVILGVHRLLYKRLVQLLPSYHHILFVLDNVIVFIFEEDLVLCFFIFIRICLRVLPFSI